MTRVQVMVDGSTLTQEMKLDLDSDALIYNEHRYHLEQLTYRAPTTGTLYGILLNDKKFVDEMDAEFHQAPYNKPPAHPVMYIKPINTVIGHRKHIPMPKGETVVQNNAAIGMVMKQTASNVSIDNAYDYVAGYTIVNDVSIPHDTFHRPNIKNKVRDGFCPVGPWIVDKNAISDPNDIIINVSVNGDVKQKIHTRDVVRNAAELLSEVSAFMTLAKGDVLLLGIFEGAPLAQIGDTVHIQVDGIGTLENTIVPDAEWVPGGDG